MTGFSVSVGLICHIIHVMNIPKREWSCKEDWFLIKWLVVSWHWIFSFRQKIVPFWCSPYSRITSKGSFPLSTRTQQQLSPRKRFFFSLFLIVPLLLFFVALEMILRIAGYGPDLSLFSSETIAGKEYLTMNPAVKNRYFSQVDFNPTTSPEYFSSPKPEGTFRIFCLGGSTTVGYPYWYNGSFSSFLRDRLQATFPDKRIEIINLGMTATNSYTVLDMAGDLAPYKPDLFLIYDGHNEFYGALGIASHESAGTSRWTALLYLRLVHLRSFLLVRDVLRSVFRWFGKEESGSSRTGTMMEQLSRGQYIRVGDSRYLEALTAFRDNLSEIVSLSRNNGIPVIFGTQVSNLKDQPPFVSSSSDAQPLAERESFLRSLSNARAYLLQSRIAQAKDTLQRLTSLDGQHAEVHYLLGKCFQAQSKYDSARAAFTRARDFDQLRFRMSSDFNESILALKDLPSVAVVDMEALFARSSPHGLVGNNLITEHLHPNARGYFLMAKAYAGAIREMGILATPDEWASNDTISDETFWKNRHLTEIDELIAERRTEVLTSGWPFKDQYPIVDPVPEKDTLRSIAERATRGILNWKKAHEQAADYYEGRKEFEKAELEYRTIINQIPLDVRAYLRLARLQLDRDLIGLARQTLLASMSVEETALASRALGDIALRSGRSGDAVTHYERLAKFPQSPQERDENGYLLALAYLQSNNPDAAVRLLERLILENPAHHQANELLKRIKELSSRDSPPR